MNRVEGEDEERKQNEGGKKTKVKGRLKRSEDSLKLTRHTKEKKKGGKKEYVYEEREKRRKYNQRKI